jgi:hypothetical protein
MSAPRGIRDAPVSQSETSRRRFPDQHRGEFDVLVIDIASRHLPAEEAARRTRAAVAASSGVALEWGRNDLVPVSSHPALDQARPEPRTSR